MTKSCEYGRRFAGGTVQCAAKAVAGSMFCQPHRDLAQQRVAEDAEAAPKFKVYRRPDPGKVLRP